MKKCILCQKDIIFTCPCGFCVECLVWKTHRGCVEAMQDKLDKEYGKPKKG